MYRWGKNAERNRGDAPHYTYASIKYSIYKPPCNTRNEKSKESL